jgi:hypothetical protein
MPFSLVKPVSTFSGWTILLTKNTNAKPKPHERTHTRTRTDDNNNIHNNHNDDDNNKNNNNNNTTTMMINESKINNKALNRGRSEVQFPGKLHAMMAFVERENLESIVSWVMDGTAILVNDPENLVKILPLFFSQTKYRSFQRQLNMWRFERILDGPYKGAFSHPYFLQGQEALCSRMSRHVDIITLKKTIAAENTKINDLPTTMNVLIQTMPMTTGLRTISLGEDEFNSMSNGAFCSISSALATAQSILNNPSSAKISPNDQSDFLQDGDLVAFEGRQFHFVDDEDMAHIEEATSLAPSTSSCSVFPSLPTILNLGFDMELFTSLAGRPNMRY